MSYQILRPRAAAAKCGFGKSTLYDKIDPRSPRHDPSFPRPISLGARSVGFVESELDAWLAARMADQSSRQTDMAARRPRTRPNAVSPDELATQA